MGRSKICNMTPFRPWPIKRVWESPAGLSNGLSTALWQIFEKEKYVKMDNLIFRRENH